MEFTKFIIRNFKGIKEAEIPFKTTEQGKIFTLVGLNESGKTTILEAINSFSPDVDTEKLYQNDVFKKIEYRDLVPKDRKDNFTGSIEIEAFLNLSESDKTSIARHYKDSFEMQLDTSKLEDTIRVKRVYTYKQSDYIDSKTTWWITFSVKRKKGRNYKTLDSKHPEWKEGVRFVRTLIPGICYFPTFLFEFPSRVYLSKPPEKYKPQNTYYRQLIQDILDSLDRDLNIDTHIVDRVVNFDDNEEWSLSNFLKSDRKEQIDAVMNRLGLQISNTVFKRWNEIFGSKFTKNIKIDWAVDGDCGEPPIYLSFNVQDGTSTYSIAERSLGFRWFFCFLLLTQFRKTRGSGGTLFLLDEPASNLHATAQKQLLDSFISVVEADNHLVYSTHSHYMINPRWLEGAFIVQNKSIEYETELYEESMHRGETDIIATPYRRYVGENKDKVTYYQPILDALDYIPSILEDQSNTIMVEGKGDFYIFSYFFEVVLKKRGSIRILPSSGANELGPLISLYLGWGYTFLVLLDDDTAGRSAKKHYLKEWFLTEDTVLTIGNIDPKLRKKRLEGLISRAGKDLIKEELGSRRLTKKQMTRYFQGKIAKKEMVKFDVETVENMKLILCRINNHFKNLKAAN